MGRASGDNAGKTFDLTRDRVDHRGKRYQPGQLRSRPAAALAGGRVGEPPPPLAPSVEREIRNQLAERAEKEAVKVFAKNTENLLMTPPVKGARHRVVLEIEPGFEDRMIDLILTGDPAESPA